MGISTISVLMAICDAYYCFTFVDVGAYGKFSDSSVFKNGKFFEKLENETLSIPQPKPLPGDNENGPLPYVILADEAFEVSKTILRPYARSPSHISVLHKKITKASPGVFTKRFIEQRSNKKKTKLKRRQLFGNSKSSKEVYNGPDRDYGCIQEELQILDMDPKEFNVKKIKFLESLSKTNDEIKTLEESTKNQSESELWKVERSIRLTASNFGKVCKLRATTSRKNTVKSMLYQKILRDDVFFELRMQQQLISFYHDHLLLEILDSRLNRGLPIGISF
ncbi:hypothetical protein QTP88_010978 [Uroleucon formosanum]